VRRFKVNQKRSKNFSELHARLLFSKETTTILDEFEFQKLQGPYSVDLLNYINIKRNEYDIFVFITYLFFTSFFGLLIVPEKSILIPTAHNEPTIYFDIFKTIFRIPKGIIFLTEEEKEFVHNLFHNEYVPYKVIGIGIDFIECDKTNVQKLFKLNFPFPYIVYAGRIEEAKNIPELIEFFLRYKKDNPSNLKLVLIGERSIHLPNHRDIIYLGNLSEGDRLSVISTAKILIQPSKYESFSLVLLEAWSQKVPVLVNGNCSVLKGHVLRSNGGLYYRDYLEFVEVLDLLIYDKELRDKLGENGYAYVKQNYSWEKIELQYVNFIQSLVKKE
jgi:glycosyltransferase involved in cell wall biosynthesis